MRLSIRRPLGVILAAAVLAGSAMGAGPASVGAASISFGTPTATSVFGTGIDFRQPYSGTAPAEAGIVISYEGSFGTQLTNLETVGASTLAYHLDTSTGQLQPNTQLVAHFQVTFKDGTIQNGPDVDITYLDDRFHWQTMTGTIVRVHWYQGDNSFGQQALQMGDDGIAKAAAFLDFKETAPVDFYVYADQTAFYDALGPGTRENVGGEANTQTRTLFALIAPDELSYAAIVVPHELTHVVFDDKTTNPYHMPPHWLNEGIAVYVSEGYGSSDGQLVRDAAGNGGLMPLSALTGQFPTQNRFFLAYAEAVSAVDFFMRAYGHASLIKLLNAYGTGASDDEAFGGAIGLTAEAFDKAWQKANGVTALQTFGPQPAPTGPLPPGWTITGQHAGSVAQGAAPASRVGSAPAGPASGSRANPDQGGSGVPVPILLAGAAGAALVIVLAAMAVTRRSRARGQR